MRLVLFILLNCFIMHANTVIEEFHQLNSKEQEENFINKYKTDQNPTIQAFVCAVEMKQANYKINPFSKLSIFNKTKSKLNQLIVEYPENLALRYVRLVVQERIPVFLGYKEHIETDKKMITDYLNNNTISPNFKAYIYSNTSL